LKPLSERQLSLWLFTGHIRYPLKFTLSYHTVAGLAADVEFEKSAWVPRFSLETSELGSRVD
jgi:hypothetical protein